MTRWLEDVVNAAIAAGGFTLQIQTTGLDLTNGAQTATNLTAQVFASDTAAISPPKFDTTTDWPVLADSLNDPQSIAHGAKANFSSAYLVNGTFVAGTNEHVTVSLRIVIDGTPVTLQIHEAILTFELGDDAAKHGVLAGVLDTTELVAGLRPWVTSTSSQWCGFVFDQGLAPQFEHASDILLDRTDAAGRTCTAVSIGIGFTASVVANPTTIATVPLPSDPCERDAGID